MLKQGFLKKKYKTWLDSSQYQLKFGYEPVIFKVSNPLVNHLFYYSCLTAIFFQCRCLGVTRDASALSACIYSDALTSSSEPIC